MPFERTPTRFPELNTVLEHLVSGIRDVLGPNLVGVYLQGSFAVGDADENSDVDWAAVTNHDIDAVVHARLNEFHRELHARPETWAQHLEGSYFPRNVLKNLAEAPTELPGSPRDPGWTDPSNGAPLSVYPVLYLNNGSNTLIRSQHDNSLAVRWVLREHGITLFGPPPATLIDPIEPADLANAGFEIMRWWGADLLSGRANLDALWIQGFAALFFPRVLATAAEGRLVSKREAVAWAKANLDPRWHPLVERAWADRDRYPRGHGAPESHAALKPDLDDVAATLEFVRYALDLADRK
ncbi:MAG: aminoglycoside adenylyltransferase domain-containing protein [Dehalococcoidia bacterium]